MSLMTARAAAMHAHTHKHTQKYTHSNTLETAATHGMRETMEPANRVGGKKRRHWVIKTAKTCSKPLLKVEKVEFLFKAILFFFF